MKKYKNGKLQFEVDENDYFYLIMFVIVLSLTALILDGMHLKP